MFLHRVRSLSPALSCLARGELWWSRFRLPDASSRQVYLTRSTCAGYSSAVEKATRKHERLQSWSRQHQLEVLSDQVRLGSVLLPRGKELEEVESTAQTSSHPTNAASSTGLSEVEWALLELPSNKKILYEVLKSFQLNQHVLLIGETGTGKTWIARAVSKLLRMPLMMASLNEYTKNEDLISRITFGEEAAGRTGITKSIVLNWMEEGGVLLLDELHKPLDGLSALNNILQYGEFRMADGQVVRLDPAQCHCIGTMNPVRPPYRGEVPSAELVSRFATVLSVDFLPAHEETDLLRRCTDPAILPREVLSCVVDVANDLRKSYPSIVPLPMATRTLLDIVRRWEAFPEDDVAEAFLTAYNPVALVDDQRIGEAIENTLRAYGIAGTLSEFIATLRAARGSRVRSSGSATDSGANSSSSTSTPPAVAYPRFYTPSSSTLTSSSSYTSTSESSSTSLETPSKKIEHIQTLLRLLSGESSLTLVPFRSNLDADLLARPLDPRIGNRPGGEVESHWRILPSRLEVQYPLADFVDPDIPSALLLGRAIHEVWHLLWSRLDIAMQDPILGRDVAFLHLWNAVEDCRINTLGTRKHAGSRGWIKAAYAQFHNPERIYPQRIERAHQQMGPASEFLHAIPYLWDRGEDDPRVLNESVHEAIRRLEETLFDLFSEQDPSRAYALLKDKVWPEFQELLKVEHGSENSTLQQNSRRMLTPTPANRLLQLMMKPDPNRTSAEEKMRQEVIREIETAFDEMRELDQAKRPQAADEQPKADVRADSSRTYRSSAPVPPAVLEWQYARYERVAGKIRPHVALMRYQLTHALKAAVRKRRIGHRRTGELDLTRLADIPAGHQDLFTSTHRPSTHSYRVSLLVDTSGSMQAKQMYQHAAEAALLFIEGLEGVPGVQFEVCRFDTRTEVLKRFDQRLEYQDRVEIVRKLSQPMHGTDCHRAVTFAVERARFRCSRRARRLLIVVTDGLDTGSTEFQALLRDNADTEIHGIGLASAGDQVLRYFPKGCGWKVENAAHLATQIREILQSRLVVAEQ